jgi:hypothetical protein
VEPQREKKMFVLKDPKIRRPTILFYKKRNLKTSRLIFGLIWYEVPNVPYIKYFKKDPKTSKTTVFQNTEKI